MRSDELETILRDTLDDARLSRSERRALTERLSEFTMDDNTVARCHSVAFDLAQEVIDPVNTTAVLGWLSDVSSVLRNAGATKSNAFESEVHFSPGDSCWQRINGLLRIARHSVDICVFTITDNRISTEIEAAHSRGVNVRIITDNDKAEDRGSDADRLARHGIPLRVDRTDNHMHHKFAVFDTQRVVTGSYNWTRSAATSNEENIVVTDDAKLVASFAAEFERLWQQFGD